MKNHRKNICKKSEFYLTKKIKYDSKIFIKIMENQIQYLNKINISINKFKNINCSFDELNGFELN